MRKVVGMVLILFITTSYGQTISFMKTYGNAGYDFGRDVKQDYDTGYICTGSSSSFLSDNAEAFLLKVDSIGNFEWSYNYGGEGTEWGESVVVTLDSNYALAGHTNSFGAGGFDFYLVKAGNLGTPLFSKTYGGLDWDKAFDLVQLPDSGYALVGETCSYGAGNRDAYIIRTDKNGDTLWTKTFGGIEDDYLNAVIYDGDSLLACGGTESFGAGMSDGLIIKMGLDGNIGWIDTVGMENQDYFTSVDFFGSYYVLGGIRSYDYATTKEDQWVYKIENDNSVIHIDDIYGGSSEDDGLMDIMVRDVNEDLILAGRTESWGLLDGHGDIILSKFSSNFFFITNNTYGEAGVDLPYAIEETKDDGFIVIADFTLQSTGGNNLVLLKNSYLWDWFDIFTEIESEIITMAISEANQLNLNIYPAYVNHDIKIESQDHIEKVIIFDMNGKRVFVDTSGKSLLALDFLEAGMYVITILVEDAYFSQKFIKN